MESKAGAELGRAMEAARSLHSHDDRPRPAPPLALLGLAPGTNAMTALPSGPVGALRFDHASSRRGEGRKGGRRLGLGDLLPSQACWSTHHAVAHCSAMYALVLLVAHPRSREHTAQESISMDDVSCILCGAKGTEQDPGKTPNLFFSTRDRQGQTQESDYPNFFGLGVPSLL